MSSESVVREEEEEEAMGGGGGGFKLSVVQPAGRGAGRQARCATSDGRQTVNDWRLVKEHGRTRTLAFGCEMRLVSVPVVRCVFVPTCTLPLPALLPHNGWRRSASSARRSGLCRSVACFQADRLWLWSSLPSSVPAAGPARLDMLCLSSVLAASAMLASSASTLPCAGL